MGFADLMPKEFWDAQNEIAKQQQKDWIAKHGDRKTASHEEIEKMCFSCKGFGGYKYPNCKQIPYCKAKTVESIYDYYTGVPLIYRANPFCECSEYKKAIIPFKKIINKINLFEIFFTILILYIVDLSTYVIFFVFNIFKLEQLFFEYTTKFILYPSIFCIISSIFFLILSIYKGEI